MWVNNYLTVQVPKTMKKSVDQQTTSLNNPPYGFPIDIRDSGFIGDELGSGIIAWSQ